jgi:hypothetical protein
MSGADVLFSRAWRVFSLGLAALVGAALVVAGAEAEKKRIATPKSEDAPMRIVIVRSSAIGCEPNCPEWISAEGRIYASSAGLLKKVLKEMGSRALPVIVSSPGGDINAAIRMGRMIRAKDLDVAVGYTAFAPCGPADKSCKPAPEDKNVYRGTLSSIRAYCFSACPLVLAGGRHRLVGVFASAGVHRITSYYSKTLITYREWYRLVKGKKRVISRKEVGRKIVGSYASTGINPAVSGTIRTYLAEMGIGASLQKLMEATPADQIHVLTMSELDETKLVLSPTGSYLTAAELYGNADLCKASVPERNCVKREAVAARP